MPRGLFAEDPDRLARFEREAKAVAALAHPNILVLHDVGTAGGAPYVVTELLEGRTLRQRLAQAALPWRTVDRLSRDGYVRGEARAWIYTGLGDTERAFRCLDQVCDERGPGIV